MFLFLLGRGGSHALFLLNVDRKCINSISLFPGSVNDVDVQTLLFRQRDRCVLHRLPVGIIAVPYASVEHGWAVVKLDAKFCPRSSGMGLEFFDEQRRSGGIDDDSAMAC